MTKQYPMCEEDSPAQPRDKLLVHDIPKLPWAKVGMDLFTVKGKEYLLIVDYLTDFFEVSELPDTTAAMVVHATKQQFARHGIPVLVHTDGGPQFMSQEFKSFSKTWEFQHSVSLPYNSRSNGKVESAIKIAKRLFKRSPDPYLALLEWRNTPTMGFNASPGQRLLARRTRGIVPSSQGKLAVEPPPADGWERKIARQQQMLRQQDKTHSDKPLQRGQPVLVQDLRARKKQWMRGRCVDRLTDRSYTVEVDGKLLHHNRQFLKPSQNAPREEEHGGQEEEHAEQAAPSGEEVVLPAGHESGRQTTLAEKVTVPANQDSSPVRDGSERSRNLTPAPSANRSITHNTSTRPSGAAVIRAPTQGEVTTRDEVTTRSGRTSRKPSCYVEQY